MWVAAGSHVPVPGTWQESGRCQNYHRGHRQRGEADTVRQAEMEGEIRGEEESMMEKKKRGVESERNSFSLAQPSLPVTGSTSGLTCVARSGNINRNLSVPPPHDCMYGSLPEPTQAP